MVSFIHIADRNSERLIVRNGIRTSKGFSGPRGVYAVPVVPDFSTTHQWARELRRWGARTLICVQFRVSSDELVLVGRYNGEKSEMTASEAAAVFLEHADPVGLEAIIPRRILPRENRAHVSGASDHRPEVLSRSEGATAILPLQILQSRRNTGSASDSGGRMRPRRHYSGGTCPSSSSCRSSSPNCD